MDGPTVLYIVVFIAVLNVIAFATVNDWKSIIFLALAAGATYALNPDLTLALVVGIVACNMYRALTAVNEGMTDKTKKPAKASAKETEKAMKKTMEEDKDVELEAGEVEGMSDLKGGSVDVLKSLETADLGTLMKQQMTLMKSISSMGPLMQSAKDALAHIPKDFLEKAVKNVRIQ